jgi:microcystin-dependent protein
LDSQPEGLAARRVLDSRFPDAIYYAVPNGGEQGCVGLDEVITMAEPFIGEISPVGFAFAPKGWAMCNGQLLSIAQNQALFSVLGTTYGGDGVSTFALPDLRGRAIVHSSASYTLGSKGGVEAVTLSVNQIPAHSHAPVCSTQAGSAGEAAGLVWAGSSINETLFQAGSNPNGSMATGLITPSGSSQAHSNLQPFLVVNFIIALQGVYPSRN